MKPKRIILVRHGESQGNIDKTIYSKIPDYAVPLTDNGKHQAFWAGPKIRKALSIDSYIDKPQVFFYVSPFRRTRETFQEIAKDFNEREYQYREDPRLIEQMWSGRMPTGFDEEQEKEREGYGSFYYRFDGGENILDCYIRVSSFLDTLFRDFEKKDFPENVVIIAHGMLNRVFLMRWFHWTVEEFEMLSNPKNCELFVLERQEDEKYKLITEPKRRPAPTHPHQFPIEIQARE
jgi:broad specificity phosphatase PhoE